MNISAKLFFYIGHWFQRRFSKFSHKYILKTVQAPCWPCVLTDQIRFSYLCRRSPSDLFYQITLNSEHRLQKRRSSKLLFPR